MGVWGSRFIEDDDVLDFLEELRGKSSRSVRARLKKVVSDYMAFEASRVAGTNIIPPESEEEIRRLIAADAAFAAIADEMRKGTVDVGANEGARLLISIRLMLCNFEPVDDHVPTEVRVGVMAKYVPSAGEWDSAVKALGALRQNMARWPAELNHLKPNLVKVSQRVDAVRC